MNKEKLFKMLPFLQSARFWQVVIVVSLMTMQKYGFFANDTVQMVSEIIQIVLGVSVGIRTIDKISETKAVVVETPKDLQPISE